MKFIAISRAVDVSPCLNVPMIDIRRLSYELEHCEAQASDSVQKDLNTLAFPMLKVLFRMPTANVRCGDTGVLLFVGENYFDQFSIEITTVRPNILYQRGRKYLAVF
jgi:hypothetical protein